MPEIVCVCVGLTLCFVPSFNACCFPLMRFTFVEVCKLEASMDILNETSVVTLTVSKVMS